MTDTIELTAKRIADRGRDALLARLRPAFADAASAHAEILHLDDEQLEQMVQRAADRADGLQWRRALASVASEELGIGLGEALGHPAVERAQAIVGAPSYEDSLAALEARSDAPVALDRRPKPVPTEPKPEETRAEATGAKPMERPVEATNATPAGSAPDERPTRADPEATRVAPVPPDQPRVRRIERPPAKEEPGPTVRRLEREPDRPPAEATRTDRPGADATRAERQAAEATRTDRPPAEATRTDRPAAEATRAERASAEPTQIDRPSPQPAGPPRPAAGPRPAGPPRPTDAARPAGAARPSAQSPRPAPRRIAPTSRPSEQEGLRVSAVHLGGVSNLRPGESEIELRLSEHGLDIAREGGEIIGRLGWDEIQGLEVPSPRGFLWKRRSPRSHLVVRAHHGDASFEIPSVYPDELTEHLQPVVERYGRRVAMR